MRKPVSVEVGVGRWVDIQYKEVTSNDADGEYFYDESKQIIEIKDDLDGPMLFSTLVHELTHAGFDVSGMDEMFTLKQEEAICKMNEMIFSHLLKMDPKSKHIKWKNFD